MRGAGQISSIIDEPLINNRAYHFELAKDAARHDENGHKRAIRKIRPLHFAPRKMPAHILQRTQRLEATVMTTRNTAATQHPLRLIAAPLALSLAIVLACLLGGCAQQSAAASSAGKLSFAPACADSYQAALAAAQEEASDAKLVAMRTSSYALEGSTPSWMYLFYSWERASSFTVFITGDQASVGASGNLPFTQDDFAAIPDASEIVYDADAAYEELLKAIEGEWQLVTCRAYLMTYAEGDADPTADSLKWFFSFNEADDVADASSSSAENETSSQTAGEPRAFSVDARTGEVAELATAIDEEHEPSAN